MSDVIASHAREAWTGAQMVLGTACTVLGIAIAFFGFTDIYLSVTHLLAAWWGAWAWTVILLGEGSGIGSYLGWLLLDLRDSPPRRVRAFLAAYLAGFAGVSLALMLYAGRAAVPDLLSHALIVAAFYGYLVFAKVLVRRLSADPAAREAEQALADARRYAMDLLRDRKGALWRWRPSVPSLLRRQVLTGRLPAAVLTAVRESLREYGQPWEETVREWVLGPAGLNLSAQAEMASQKAAETIRQEVPEGVPQTVPEAPSGTVPEAVSGPSRSASPGAPRKPSPSAVKRMSGADLAPYVGTLLEGDPGLTKAAVMKALRVGEPKAAEALRIARRNMPTPLRVAR